MLEAARQAAAISQDNGGLLFEAVICCLAPAGTSVGDNSLTPPSAKQAPSSAPRSAINVQTGEVYPGVAGGVINPRNGQFYPDVGGGYIDTTTGKFIPRQ